MRKWCMCCLFGAWGKFVVGDSELSSAICWSQFFPRYPRVQCCSSTGLIRKCTRLIWSMWMNVNVDFGWQQLFSIGFPEGMIEAQVKNVLLCKFWHYLEGFLNENWMKLRFWDYDDKYWMKTDCLQPIFSVILLYGKSLNQISKCSYEWFEHCQC